jgi:hypothetical protein
VPTPLERLDRAFADADAATGADFFRRLRDYKRLLDSDDAIRVAVERIEREVESVGERLEDEDQGVVRDMIRCRQELAERVPAVDDSGQPRPAGSRIDLEARNRLDTWTWTLSNFDAVAADDKGGVVQRRGLDGTRARMLGEILNAKLHDLQHPNGHRRSERRDLDDLFQAINAARARHIAAQQNLEEVTESSGFLPHRRVRLVASYLEPHEPVPAETEDEERERAEAVLMEVSGEFHHLREAVRPEEARGRLGADAQRAVERHETECRKDLIDLNRSLRLRLEEIERETAPKGWKALDTSQKIQVAGIAAATFIGIAAIVVTVALTGG